MKKYNPEIDGLRAIAALSVIFFHFDIPFFSGGFVGVDIFFVISGFLITRLVLEDINRNKFSFKSFYLRRTRRLFPALFTVLAITFISATLLFSPEDLEKLAGSLVYSLASVSNIYFWNQAGYFDTEASLKPLLHTWSLSVEEQFYLIWPALLYICIRNAKKATPYILIALGLASLILCEYTLSKSPSSAFYWMPLRIFEFAIGGILYWTQSLSRPNSYRNSTLAFIGLGLIAYSVLSLDETSRFPGLLALLPCIGTACLIQAGPSNPVGRLLSSRPATTIGLLSYSLYLVHWPLVVFFKYTQSNSLNGLQQAVLVAATFILATLLYLLIEKPLRYSKPNTNESSNTGFALCCTIAALALTLPAADAWANRGWTWRYSEATKFLAQYDINDKDYVWALWRKLEAKKITTLKHI
ncbi:acyltransferase [Pseudomonas sp. J452]|uniref:acyltransferase family protein n=1 Tax=Pseudomonas sp. J452 TaxID=2898441 RepID=UPI0021AD8E6D|nr:acyltransferase [Pseudomonas sp. J452]UUY09837.1 acyltransferase [Pseudomonas sp. J452]